MDGRPPGKSSLSAALVLRARSCSLFNIFFRRTATGNLVIAGFFANSACLLPGETLPSGMVWIIALACLGLLAVVGYYQGPIRTLFSLFGLLFGIVLCGPLKPLTKPLLPLFGLHHPMWSLFVPQLIAFIL